MAGGEPGTPEREAAGQGPAARAQALLQGIVQRLSHEGGLVARPGDRGRTDLVAGDRVVVSLEPADGGVRADVDPRAQVGDAPSLRRLGVPHPEAALSRQGWRRFRVRTHADGARLVHALRPPRDKATGEVAPRRAAPFVVGRVRVRRLTDPPAPEDGARVLVDERWPAGVRREDCRVDAWMPEAAPSRVLRAAYGAVPAQQRGFRRAYLAELTGGPKAAVVSRLRHLARQGPLTLLTDVREVQGSHARVLAAAVTRGRTPRA